MGSVTSLISHVGWETFEQLVLLHVSVRKGTIPISGVHRDRDGRTFMTLIPMLSAGRYLWVSRLLSLSMDLWNVL
jgi:hypothetical protein